MNTHNKGRDPARTPARAEKPRTAGEKGRGPSYMEWELLAWSRALRDSGLRAHNHLARGAKA